MTKQFTYLNISFDYDLVLEKRRTMVIEVKPDQSVIVKAPPDVKDDKIQEFIQHKILWILKHRRRYAKFRPAARREYVDGEIFRYLGKGYQLQVQDARGDERVCVQENRLEVFSRRPQSRLYTRNLLDTWYQKEAARVFAEQLRAGAARFNLPDVPNLAIRRMTSRLGSYSTKTHRVCLSFDLIKVDLQLIDYVVIHELCHITHHAHNNDFYDLLSSYLPEWERLETELERSLLSG
jgi:hypothetical protein